MATLRGFDRKLYFSYIHEQGTWGTLEADANLFPFRVNSDPFAISPELVSDVDEIGGSEESTAQEELSTNVAGSLSQNKVVAPFAASILAFALGASTDSTQDTNAGRHIITPYTTDFSVKTFSALDLYTTSVYRAYHNMAVDSFELSTSRKGWASLSAQVVGSGKNATSGVTVGNLGAAPTMGPALKAGDCKIFLSVDAGTTLPGTYAQGTEDLPGSATDISAKIRNFRWRYSNGLISDDAFEPGSGLFRARAERDRRSQSVSFDVEFEDHTYLGYLTAQNTLAIEFDFTSATLAGAGTVYYGMNILFPMLKLTSAVVSGGVGSLVVSCEALVMDDGTNPTVQATVFDKNTTGLLQ